MRSWFERKGSPALAGFIVATLLLIAPGTFRFKATQGRTARPQYVHRMGFSGQLLEHSL